MAGETKIINIDSGSVTSVITPFLSQGYWQHNDGANVINTIRSISADAGNLLGAGSDGGAFLAAFKLGLNIQDEGTTTITAVKSGLHPVDVSSGVATVNPFASPVAGDMFGVSDSRSNAGSNNITVDFVTATQNFHGDSANDVLATDKVYAVYLYIDATIGWIRL